jgi:RNA polymerase sigma-70 factor (ECF subfamily)
MIDRKDDGFFLLARLCRQRAVAEQEITSDRFECTGSAEVRVNEPDETLMLRVGTGDHAACHELVERHLGRIVSFAGRILGDRGMAEDVAQEVFLRLWSHAQRWRPTGARLTTWLHRVALNLCLDWLARRRETPLDETDEPVDRAPHAIALLQGQDLSQQVSQALAELPDKQRIALTLCYYQGLRNIEAAETMEISVEALESLLARGRRTLKARLRDVAPDLLGDA